MQNGCSSICFSVLTVHMDIPFFLSIETFTKVLRRFTSRRWKLHTINSDDSVNCVDASAVPRYSRMDLDISFASEVLKRRVIKWNL